MARMLKCWGSCGEKHDAQSLRKVGKLNYCDKCYDDAIEKEKNKILEAKRKEIEKREREDLYRAIRMYYRVNGPNHMIPGMILRQVKSFKEQYDFTYKGMLMTLKYVFEVERSFAPSLKYGIGFLPRKYEDARKYYINQIKQSASVMENSNRQNVVIERKVSKTAIEQKVELVKEIDMEDLL